MEYQQGLSRMRLTHRTKESGILVIELLLAIIIMSIVLPVFIYFLITTYTESVITSAKTDLFAENSRALRFIEQSVRSGKEFSTGTASPFTDAYGPRNLGIDGSEAWSYKGASAASRVLIVKSNAVTSNVLNNLRRPVYKTSPYFSCVSQKEYLPKLEYLSIYFVRDGNLYKRTLTDAVSPLCAGESQAQKQSCPPELSVSSRDASCSASDEILATGVTEFSVSYFQITSENADPIEIDAYSSNDPEVLSVADSISIKLTLSARSNTVNVTLDQKVTKQNVE